MKKILIPNSLEQINKCLDNIDGYIVGINDMSVNTFYNIEIDDLSDLDYSKEIFISLNKNMENKDIEFLKEILIKLKDYPICGVLYSDVCFVNMKKELELNYPLVWNQEHLSTNYETINYWYSKGIEYAYLSSDISLQDMLEIREKCNSKLMVNIFGYLPMFVSKRHIVKNYLKKFNIDSQSLNYYMEKENSIYPIIDNDIGTQVFSGHILNGIKEYNNLKNYGFEYAIINGFDINDDILLNILKLINKINDSNINDIYSQINELIPNTNTGFMYLNTLSRVKKNEKKD